TTKDGKDAWFIGYTAEIPAGAYTGSDKPRHLGRGATGGHLAAPIVKDFLKAALADKPPVPFRIPPGLKLVRIDPRTGMRAVGGEGRSIYEAYKPGTAPPDSYAVIGDVPGMPGSDGRSPAVPVDAQRRLGGGVPGGMW